MRILIVEDQKNLANTLADIMTENNHIADTSFDGESGLDNALTGIYDAIILDVMLPGLDGFEIVRRLRKESVHTPIIMLTAKTELGDRVKGLDSGADYYLTKPFEVAELLACLRAVLRRKGEVQMEEASFGDLTLNLSTTELICGERRVRLGSKELELMRLLMENRDILLPKETILLKIWGYDSNAEGNTVEVYMSFLRKKMAHIKSSVKISAVRMVGYHLEA